MAHDRLYRLLTPLGRLWAVHLTPPLLVASTSAERNGGLLPLVFSPTAKQVEFVGQSTPKNVVEPASMACFAQLCPPSVLTMMVFPPTAQQCGAVGQATEVVWVMPLGGGSEFQVAPPFEVITTSACPDWKLPAATHSLVVGHDTENIWPEPGGSASLVQAAPPS